LDLGCAVGRSTFELARRCTEVVGIDYSRSFIHSANQLKKRGHLKFQLCEEGNHNTPSLAKVDARIERNNVHFQVGDALHLPRDLGTFDLVLAANLIDRLPNPTFFASKVAPGLVKPNGFLLLTSPYTWSKEYTPESKWWRNSFATLKKLLQPHFRLTHRQDLSFLLREHRRKFQYTFADATLWVRNSFYK
jgi:putative 4-mercaptohistidine N1-methyltranferase